MKYRVYMRSDEDKTGLSCPVGCFASVIEAKAWTAANVADVFLRDCFVVQVSATPEALVLHLVDM